MVVESLDADRGPKSQKSRSVYPSHRVSLLTGRTARDSGGTARVPYDTTRTIVGMLFHETFKRYPDIRFIFSHAGGTVPFLVDRIGIVPMLLLDPDGPSYFLKLQYFDLALSAKPHGMSPLLGMVDVSHVLLGTDYPFAPMASIRRAVKGIAGGGPAFDSTGAALAGAAVD